MSYLHDKIVHNTKAPKEVVPILIDLLKPNSVVDVGCGLGTWLSVFEDFGVKDIVGIDGEYVDRSLLYINEDKFISHDLTKLLKLDRKFDLVVCLEVAEHISEVAADTFVEGLVSLGDFILFSAAIPNQGGQNHLNEQWPTYWQGKFKHHNFDLYDCIRADIWLNENIEWWYKQNIFLAVKEDTKLLLPKTPNLPHIVHPKLYDWRIRQLEHFDPTLKNVDLEEVSVKVASKIFLRAFNKEIVTFLRTLKKKTINVFS